MENGIFKNEDLTNLRQYQIAIEQLKNIGNFWIGPDIKLEGKRLVPPLGLIRDVNIIIKKEDLPKMEISRGALGSLSWSVRSCLAQSGIEIKFHRDTLSDEMIKNINDGMGVPVPVSIENHTNRPIELEGEVVRFFWVNDTNRLRQGELREALGSELIIEGEEGKDWSFGDVDLGEKNVIDKAYDDQLKDVCIKLPLKERFYIPPSTESLIVKSKKDLPSVLKEIPDGLKLDFKIGETTKVKLSANIIAVINMGAYDDSGRHIRSPLIDSGFEGNIRTETVSGLNYIELFLYKK